MPDFIEPCHPKIGAPPESGQRSESDQWAHEIKFDGYRLQAHVSDGQVRLFTRRGFDWTERFQSIGDDLSQLPVKSVIIDGEVVVPDVAGIPDFHLLEADLARGRQDRFVYYAFDLMYLDGFDLRAAQLRERRSALESAIGQGSGHVRLSEYIHPEATTMLELACRMKLEGIISKRLDSPYRSGKQDCWLKQKCRHSDSFPIIAFVEKLGAKPRRIASLYLGQWVEGELLYAGKAETGFKTEDLYRLRERLDPHVMASSPLAVPIDKPKATWVEPVVQAEVEYSAFTSGGRLRAPVYKGLRDDLAPRSSVPRDEGSQRDRGAARTRTRVAARSSITPRSVGRSAVPKENILQWLPQAVAPTKTALQAYWRKIHPLALPHLARRPLKLVRNVGGTIFYHKGPLPKIPASVHQLRVLKREGGEGRRVWIDDLEGLLGLVDMDVIELHPWNATVDDIELADVMVFDLDPGSGIDWRFVVDTAFTLRELLAQEGFDDSWPKLTGGKGLHVMVPLKQRVAHDVAHARSKAVADRLAHMDPQRYTISAALAKREGRLFIDYLRNGRGTTAIGAFSPRARSHAPIAAPVSWHAVEEGIRADAYTMDVPPRQDRTVGGGRRASARKHRGGHRSG